MGVVIPLLVAPVVAVVVAQEVLLGLEVLELQILAAAVEEQHSLVAHHLIQAVQAAPALLSSSTLYQAKRYLRSKALPSGHARQV